MPHSKHIQKGQTKQMAYFIWLVFAQLICFLIICL